MARSCECGCGNPVAKETHRFVHGHNRRGVPLSAEARAKITGRPISSDEPGVIHFWLRKHHPKAGECEECGKAGRTDYAYLHHPQPHTRNRSDYRELCRRCHRKMDDPIYEWSKQVKTIATTESRRAGQRASTLVRFGSPERSEA